MKQRPTKRIAVVGAGAIGCWIAARLAISGQSVSVFARGAALSTLESDGLTIDEAGSRQTVEVKASADADRLGEQDVIITTVKAYALVEAATALQPMLGSETLVVPMLNGVPWWFRAGAVSDSLQSIDPNGRLESLLPVERIVGCVVHASCSCPRPGHVTVRAADRLMIGAVAPGWTEKAADIAAVFAASGIHTEISSDIRRDVWYKLWGNMTLNPISALTRSTTDRIIDDPLVGRFTLAVMAEAAAIGVAIGIPIAESGEARQQVTRRLGSFRTSMLQDLEAGKPLELDALLSAPQEIARRTGVPTPNLDALLGLTRLLAAAPRS